jgi:GxxExxY protein
MQDKNSLLYQELTETILGCCFDVMNELGVGFLESVYKNALFLAIKEKGFKIDVEKRFEVIFRGRKIGLYIADLVVEEKVIIELKCCESLLGEHQAQLINYLKVSNILVGLLVNFGKRKVEYKRLHHPDHHVACDPEYPVFDVNDSHYLFGVLK